MKTIKDFRVNGTSQWRGTEEDLIKEDDFQKLEEVYNHLKEHNWCHVYVKEGDYEGSIAKFTLSESLINTPLYRRVLSREEIYNLKCIFQGKLSWKGKRNNPKFSLWYRTCDVILNASPEDEIFKRFDIKKEKEKLLKQEVYDIDGETLSLGDEVLYINTRYGQGSSLCHGVVKEFKPDVRGGFLSVLIHNSQLDQDSVCNNPEFQIFKK